MELLKNMGAKVRPVPPAPYGNPDNYNHIAKRPAEGIENAFGANQFDNTANADFHSSTTGPEIWKQTGGEVSAFVTAIGTGGTLAGVSRYLKSQNSFVNTVCVDPFGAAMWSWFRHWQLNFDNGGSIPDGIWQGRVNNNVALAEIDTAYRV